MLSVLLIALTAVLTAWSAFEASKWGGVMSIEFSSANAARTESVRASNLANQQVAIDVGLFVSYADAVAHEDASLITFYLDRFPERLATAVDAWLETNPLERTDAPATPFDLPEYTVDAVEEAESLGQEAEAHAAAARRANQNSDNYTVTSVFFASVILLAALSTKVESARTQYVLLGLSVAIFAVTSAVIASFPIEV